jgi:hypothetical protein
MAWTTPVMARYIPEQPRFNDGSNGRVRGITAIARVSGGEEALSYEANRVGKRGITMIVIFIILGILAVASGVGTILLVTRDSARSRPYCSGYDSRNPQ